MINPIIKKICADRESNPDRSVGNAPLYHSTTGAFMGPARLELAIFAL